MIIPRHTTCPMYRCIIFLRRCTHLVGIDNARGCYNFCSLTKIHVTSFKALKTPFIKSHNKNSQITVTCKSVLRNSEDSNFLLFEITPILFIDENQIEVVPCAKFFIDVPECRCQIETTKEKANGDRFSSYW